MNESIFLLIAVNVLVLALLLLVLLFGRLHWLWRLALVVVVSGSYWLTYHGWTEAQGWPSPKPIPSSFLLHGAVIEEPNKDTGVTGAIFLWVSDLSAHKPADQPRAYLMPYSKSLHSAAQEAIRHMRNGELQLGTVLPDQAARQVSEGFAGQTPSLIEFSKLPKQTLPEK